LGKSLGFSTNNAAEIYAIGMLSFKLIDIANSHPLVKRAIIFSDSKLAIGACASKAPPLANASLIRSLRKLLTFVQTKIKVEFHWIKGHAAVGGNERVDRISKRFASVQGNSDVVDFRDTFDCHAVSSPWPFGFPLTGLPIHFFTSSLPVAPATIYDSFWRALPNEGPSVAVGRGVSRSRARVAAAGSRKSARVAARLAPILCDPVPQFGSLLRSVLVNSPTEDDLAASSGTVDLAVPAPSRAEFFGKVTTNSTINTAIKFSPLLAYVSAPWSLASRSVLAALRIFSLRRCSCFSHDELAQKPCYFFILSSPPLCFRAAQFVLLIVPAHCLTSCFASVPSFYFAFPLSTLRPSFCLTFPPLA